MLLWLAEFWPRYDKTIERLIQLNVTNINRKPHMSPWHLTLSVLERPVSRWFKFRSLISHKGAYIGNLLLLNIRKQSYMGCPMLPSDLTLCDLQRSKSRSLTFWSLTYCEWAEIANTLQLNTNRKSYMGSPSVLWNLTLGNLEMFNLNQFNFEL